MEKVYNLHQIDLADNYDGAFMFERIEKNIKMQVKNLYGSGSSQLNYLPM